MAAKKKTKDSLPRLTSRISSKELLKEIPGAKLVEFPANAPVFLEGTHTESCYLVVQGKVRILKKAKSGENIRLALIKPGEFLGEMAMLSGERRSASAVTETKVKAIVITHAEFVTLLKARNPFATRLSLQLSTLLATRCHHLLRMIARHPEVFPHSIVKKAPPLNVRAVLNRVYTLWAV